MDLKYILSVNKLSEKKYTIISAIKKRTPSVDYVTRDYIIRGVKEILPASAEGSIRVIIDILVRRGVIERSGNKFRRK